MGCLALLAFWGAILARKGGQLHRRCGRAFAVTMTATLGTAGLLCAFLLVDPLGARPPEAGLAAGARAEHARLLRELGSGLLEVSLVTAALLWFGLRALRRRHGVRARDRSIDLTVACAVTAMGLSLVTLGFEPALPYFEGRGVVAAAVGVLQIRALARAHRSRSAWLGEHLTGVMGAAAIGHGALSVNVAGQFTDDLGFAFAASVPTLVAFAVAIAWTARRWRRKLAGAPGGCPWAEGPRCATQPPVSAHAWPA